jgi:hypothetical protein
MPNEPDKFFKTALDALPDAPPPGTVFDADALWADLDRQLRPRRRFRAGWLAAACGLLTLLVGLGGWFLVSEKKPGAPAGRLTEEPIRRAGKRVEAPGNEVFKNPLVAKRVVSPPRRATPRRGTTPVPPVPDVPKALVAEAAPEAVSIPAPEPEISSHSEAVVRLPAKPVFSEKKLVESKPRFRVVPANELLAEEEARPKLHRSEGTARVTLGYRATPEPTPAAPPPVLTLTKKPD